MKSLLTTLIMNVVRKRELYGQNEDPPYGRRVRRVRRVWYELLRYLLNAGHWCWTARSAACLFITQKKCIRILFGDCESYSDKLRTCARAKPIESQLLGSEFYMKESTKPLFTEHELLTVENLSGKQQNFRKTTKFNFYH
jgi:hypothetical protein